ncbi:unnamed protein product [Heterobilharzia americana]|nr:unnamed protein product [Heterobilharzia americana]
MVRSQVILYQYNAKQLLYELMSDSERTVETASERTTFSVTQLRAIKSTSFTSMTIWLTDWHVSKYPGSNITVETRQVNEVIARCFNDGGGSLTSEPESFK